MCYVQCCDSPSHDLHFIDQMNLLCTHTYSHSHTHVNIRGPVRPQSQQMTPAVITTISINVHVLTIWIRRISYCLPTQHDFVGDKLRPPHYPCDRFRFTVIPNFWEHASWVSVPHNIACLSHERP